jgi:hypothetical protein
MSIPISETGLFQQNATQWSGKQTIDNSATEPILNELNWSANPNTYINGQRPQSFWSPADGSDLNPVIWNDFVVMSATANFSNNGNSASTVNLKLVPNKTFFDRAKVTKHYNSFFDSNGFGHDKNFYYYLKQKTIDYIYIPNVGYIPQSTYGVYRGNTFSNFDYKSLDSSNPKYNNGPYSFNRKSFEVTQNTPNGTESADPNLIYSDDNANSILSPDGLPLFLKPWYTRIGEPTNISIGKFQFGGIISSWKIIKDTGGFHYECVITDPSEILKSVNIIVSNYKGPSGYFNVINVLGYFEAMNGGIPYNANYAYIRFPRVDSANTFGTNVYFEDENNFNYNLNEDVIGMRISHIAAALSDLLRAPSPNFDLRNQNGDIQTPRIYGGPIIYGHRETMNSYTVDLSIFNLVQQNYFVEGNSGVISLYDLFSMVSKDFGYDMIVTLEGNNIKPKFIDRKTKWAADNVIPQAIQSLSSSGNNVLDASYGYELVEQNNTGQLLIGSPKEIFYQTSAIRPVYGSYRGNPILGIPGQIKITLPNLKQFNNKSSGFPLRSGEIGAVSIKETRDVWIDIFDPLTGEATGKKKVKEVINTAPKQVGFQSKVFDVEFVKIPLPEQLVRYFGPVYVTSTLEMLVVKSQKGSVIWEKFLRFSKIDIWKFLYGYGASNIRLPQLPKDHSQTGGGSLDQIYQEKLGYQTLSRDEIANKLFQTISSYAESWGKYWAVSLPDKANTIGSANEYNIYKDFKSISDESGPALGNRKLHYTVKDETYIDVNPYWYDANIYNNNIFRSTVVDSSNFPVGNSATYPFGMAPVTLGQILNSSQKIGPTAEYANLLLRLNSEYDQNNYIGYAGNDFLNGIYPNPFNDSLVAKGMLSEKLMFMNPDFTNEFDNVDPLNSVITLRTPQLSYGVSYEETFYTSDQMTGAYNDIVFNSVVAVDPISEKLKNIVINNSAFQNLTNMNLNQKLPENIQSAINRIYSNFWANKTKIYNIQGKPYIYGYFTVIEIPNKPMYCMSKKAEMQEFMMYFEGLDIGNVTADIMATAANENVYPFRIQGPPIIPTRIGVPLSLTFDNWIFRDGADCYGKDSQSKYPFMGKIDVQIDDNLNPSSYGGFSFFFEVARAKINLSSPLRQNETGSITFAGLPSGSLGDCLAIEGNLASQDAADGGPALTGINISFDFNKVSTTYEFKNFAPRFGVTSREYIERIKTAGNQAQKARMTALKLFSNKSLNAPSIKAQPQYVSRYHDRQPPHEIIFFRQFELPQYKNKRITAKSGTEQECLRDLKPNLTDVALASWDAFLAPYSLRSMYFKYFDPLYGLVSNQYYTDSNGKVYFNKLDNWSSLQNPKLNIIDLDQENIKNNLIRYRELLDLKKIIPFDDNSTISKSYNKQFNDLEDILFTPNNVRVSINSFTLNPLPKESNVDTILYKKDENNITDIRGQIGNSGAKYVTSIGLKGPLVVTGWGIDKHFLMPSGGGAIKYVGTGAFLSEDNNVNESMSDEEYELGKQSQLLSGPVDLLWDSYRGTWSTKDTELVYVKSYEKMPSGHFGYLANCIPLNFIDDFNSIDNLKTYPIVAAGISGSPAWKDNLQKITAGTGDGFQCFYSIKPQTGSIYTTTFMNNSISTTSGICLWMLNTESPIVGIYSSGSIYDMFGRIFNENVDFIHPINFISSAARSLVITNSKLENNILTLTYTGGPSKFTIGDKIKVSFTPSDPTYDGIFVITNVTSNTISYAFNGEDFEEDSDAGSITEPENVEEARQILLAKATEKSPVLLKVFPASKATYTVMKGGGSTQGGPVCNVQCVGNILTVTYC